MAVGGERRGKLASKAAQWEGRGGQASDGEPTAAAGGVARGGRGRARVQRKRAALEWEGAAAIGDCNRAKMHDERLMAPSDPGARAAKARAGGKRGAHGARGSAHVRAATSGARWRPGWPCVGAGMILDSGREEGGRRGGGVGEGGTRWRTRASSQVKLSDYGKWRRRN